MISKLHWLLRLRPMGAKEPEEEREGKEMTERGKRKKRRRNQSGAGSPTPGGN